MNYVDLSRLYNVLDIIARVPWRINDKVLKIVQGVWDAGGGIAEIPS
jgi:DNA-directed RNA polymerase